VGRERYGKIYNWLFFYNGTTLNITPAKSIGQKWKHFIRALRI